jgi:hypothetical protein
MTTVNGNKHLDNMEVATYDNLHIVTESPEPGTVRVTIYKGTDPTPLSKETYGYVSSNLDK